MGQQLLIAIVLIFLSASFTILFLFVLKKIFNNYFNNHPYVFNSIFYFVIIISIASTSLFLKLKVRNNNTTSVYNNNQSVNSVSAVEVHREFVKNPLMHSISKVYQNEYITFISSITNDINNRDLNSVKRKSYIFTNTIFLKHLKHAPNEACRSLVSSTINLYKYLLDTNPELIIKIEKSDLSATTAMLQLKNNSQFQYRLHDLLARKGQVIEGAFHSPVPITEEQQAEPILQGVMKILVENYGEENVLATFQTSSDSVSNSTKGKIFLSFYEELYKLDDNSLGIAVRYSGMITEQENIKKSN